MIHHIKNMFAQRQRLWVLAMMLGVALFVEQVNGQQAITSLKNDLQTLESGNNSIDETFKLVTNANLMLSGLSSQKKTLQTQLEKAYPILINAITDNTTSSNLDKAKDEIDTLLMCLGLIDNDIKTKLINTPHPTTKQTPLQWAQENNYKDITQLFIDAGAPLTMGNMTIDNSRANIGNITYISEIKGDVSFDDLFNSTPQDTSKKQEAQEKKEREERDRKQQEQTRKAEEERKRKEKDERDRKAQEQKLEKERKEKKEREERERLVKEQARKAEEERKRQEAQRKDAAAKAAMHATKKNPLLQALQLLKLKLLKLASTLATP